MLVSQAMHFPFSKGRPNPKVFDLSSVNNLNESNNEKFFKRKPFIIGILSVLVIAFAGGTAFYLIQNKPATTPPPRASSCTGTNCTSVSATCTAWNKGENVQTKMLIHKFNSVQECQSAFNNGEGPSLVGDLSLFNSCGQNGLTCQDNGSCSTNNALSGDDGGHYDCEKTAAIPSCSVVQLDCMSGINGAGGTIGWNCGGCGSTTPPPPPPTSQGVKCDALHLTPNVSTVTPGQVIRLKVDRSGGTGTWQTTEWAITTNPASGNKGAQSGLTGDSVNWTAPATLTAAQSWTFTGTVKDSSGATNTNANCTKTVSFSPTTTYTHNVCNADKACVSVPCNPATTACATSSDCTSSADCETTTYKFTTCENNACVSKDCPNPNVSCAQDDDCTNDNDCKSTPTHKVCRNEACVTIDGAGTDNCTNDSACQSNPTHKTCVNNACVTVNGAGSDSCTSDAMCQPEATPPPIPESGNTLMTIGTIAIGAVAILGGIFLAL
jgi:hypothetical protein